MAKGMLARRGDIGHMKMTISDITKNRFKVILSEKLDPRIMLMEIPETHFTDQDKTSVSSGRSMEICRSGRSGES